MSLKIFLKTHKSLHLQKCVLVLANSRAELLVDCINSVLNAHESSAWKKVLVLQVGYPDVEQVV